MKGFILCCHCSKAFGWPMAGSPCPPPPHPSLSLQEKKQIVLQSFLHPTATVGHLIVVHRSPVEMRQGRFVRLMFRSVFIPWNLKAASLPEGLCFHCFMIVILIWPGIDEIPHIEDGFGAFAPGNWFHVNKKNGGFYPCFAQRALKMDHSISASCASEEHGIAKRQMLFASQTVTRLSRIIKRDFALWLNCHKMKLARGSLVFWGITSPPPPPLLASSWFWWRADFSR